MVDVLRLFRHEPAKQIFSFSVAQLNLKNTGCTLFKIELYLFFFE